MDTNWTVSDFTLGRCDMGSVGLPRDGSQPTAPAADHFELAPEPINPIAARIKDNARLEAAIKAQAKLAATGDVPAARTLVSLTERRAKLLGLDAPKEVQLEVTRREPTSVREYTTAELERLLIEGESRRVED